MGGFGPLVGDTGVGNFGLVFVPVALVQTDRRVFFFAVWAKAGV